MLFHLEILTLFSSLRGVCQLCKIDAHALFCRIKSLQPAERLNTLLNANWKLPTTRRDRFLQEPEEHDFWQADHKVAVAEGGGGTGLDNLRTLCVSYVVALIEFLPLCFDFH